MNFRWFTSAPTLAKAVTLLIGSHVLLIWMTDERQLRRITIAMIAFATGAAAACNRDMPRRAAVAGDSAVAAAAGHEGVKPAEPATHVAIPPANCAPPASSVEKTGSVTRLHFANGDTLSLHDEPDGDGQVEYQSQGYLGSIGYFIVRMKMWGGPSYWFEAYSACTGTKLAIDNVPVVSPDSLHFVTVGYGVPLTPLVKRIQILSRDRSGELTMDWDFELGIWNNGKPPLEWGPVNPRWTSGASLTFDRADRNGQVVGTAAATRDAGGWHFSVTP
jgi:hypothetical protein